MDDLNHLLGDQKKPEPEKDAEEDKKRLDATKQPTTMNSILGRNVETAPANVPATPIYEDEQDINPVKLRTFQNTTVLRKSIQDKITEAVAHSYPKENDRYSLTLADVAHTAKDYTLADQKKALQTGRSLTTSIKGKWLLTDKETGKVVDQKATTLARIPYLTNRGTFIRKGSEYTVTNQMRLKPGVYTRKKASGELEAHVNVKHGTGSSFKVLLEPTSGVFKLKAGQSSWKMYPLLNAMGVTDEQLEESWGKEVLAVNKRATDSRVVQKAYDKMVSKDIKESIGENPTFEQLGNGLRNAFNLSTLDPDTTEATLGTPSNNITLDVLKRTSQKVLNISRGTEKVDARDALAYQIFMSPDDLFSERFRKDSGRLGHNLLWKATYKGNLERMPSSALNDHIDSVFNGSGLASPIEEINPMEMVDHNERVVILGDGGISDLSAVPTEAREVQPSHLMFIDPIRSPECYDDQTEVMTSTGWKYWKDVDKRTTFAGLIEGVTTYVKASKVIKQDYAGPLHVLDGTISYGVTPTHRMYVGTNDKFEFRTPDELIDNKYQFKCHGSVLSEDASLSTAERTVLSKIGVESIEELKDKAKHPIVISNMSREFMLILTKLAFNMGMTTSAKVKSVSKERYTVALVDGLITTPDTENVVIEEYIGKVYCATVPGGLLYIRRNSSYGYWCGNSMKIGIDSRFARNTMKGSDGNLYSRVIGKDGRAQFITPQIASKSIVAYPGEMQSKKNKVRAMVNGSEIKYVNKKDVDFHAENMYEMFSHTSNLTPMMTGVKGGRLFMGSKFATQALPLQNAEAPLVQSAMGAMGSDSFEADLGERMGAIKAKQPGRVVSVGKDKMKVEYADGSNANIELYNNFSFNRKTFIHNTPLVKAGDTFDSGKVLAKSNYTNEAGESSLGANVSVAYLSYKGYNYDDGIVISENAANTKFSSEHMYSHDIDRDKGVTFDKTKFIGLFPKKFNKAQLKVIDDNGVIKVGSKVNHGDPLVLSTTATKPVNSLLRGNRRVYNTDSSREWTHHAPGVVTDVYDTQGGVNVVVKAFAPAVIGDKLSGRFAGKGTIAKIVQNDQMVHGKDGKPVDVLLSPLGVVSRVNPAQVVEAQLGKLARATGKVYKMPANMDESFIEFVEKELSKAGLSDTEDLIDPMSNGRTIPKVMTGTRFLMKLHHTAEGKSSARGIGGSGGASYTSEGQPSRGGKGGAKRFCFAAHQKVKTTNGDVEISDIVDNKSEVSVWSYDWENQTCCYRKVTDWHIRTVPVSELIQIDISFTDCTRTMYVTKEHALYRVNGEEVAAGTIMIGDELATWNMFDETELGCIPCYVTDVGPYKHDKPDVDEINVYDLTVDDTHVYSAAGVFVSNSNMEIGALLSHGATEVLRDAKMVRGQRNDDYWRDFKLGKSPAPTKVPMVYKKFVNSLRAAGVNVTQTNDSTNIFSMTNKDIDKMTSHEITKSNTLDQKDRKPVPGGLFDIGATGGIDGNRWGYIKLDDPIPNPIMADPLRSILNMTRKEFENTIAGDKLHHGRRGGAALTEMLKAINIDKELAAARAAVRSSTASSRDRYIKKYKYLKAMKEKKVRPEDFMLSKIPVLPPAFRPISQLPNGTSLVADPNFLYADLMESRDDLRKLSKELSHEDLREEKLKVYNAFKAVTGMGDPVTRESKDSKVKGILRGVFGSSPKLGLFQRRVLGMSVDTVGRGVIVPDPKLNMDEVGLPVNMAWDMYKPFIIRDLVKKGTKATSAAALVDGKDRLAFEALERIIKERPLLINRAPTLHKYGLMAAFPRLVAGDALRIAPVVTPGFGADFDGNCLDFDEKLTIKVLESELNNSKMGKRYLTLLKETIMRLSSETKITVAGAAQPETLVTIPIGEFPRAGKPKKDKNGADVYTVPAGFYIQTYQHPDGESRPDESDLVSTVTYAAITKFTVEQGCPSVEVTTARKRKVIVSDNESLCVFDPSTGGTVKQAPADSIDCLMPYVVHAPVLGLRDKHWVGKDKHGNLDNKRVGWWYGMLISDGWVTPRTIGLAKLEAAKRKEFIDIANDYICGNFSQNEYSDVKDTKKNKLGNSTKIHLNGKELVDCIYNCYGIRGDKRSSLYKKIPADFINYATDEFLVGLLGGLLDGDGTLALGSKLPTGGRRRVAKLSTSSSQLVDSVYLLCRRLGIRVSLTVTPPRGVSNEAYTVSFNLNDIHGYLPSLHLVGADEKKACKAIIKMGPPSKDQIDIVPIQEDLRDFFKRYFINVDKNIYTVLTKARTIQGISRAVANKLIDAVETSGLIVDIDSLGFSDKYQQFIDIVDNEGIHWDKVAKIEDVGKRDVFDFCIPTTKVFMIQNGLIIYDTMQYHVPVSESAVKEAIDKMLPSKNLLDIADFNTHYVPRMEYLQGLHLASSKKTKVPEKVFASTADAIKAFKSGKVNLGDRVKIQGS